MATATANPTHPLSPLQEGLLAHQGGQLTGGVDLVQIVLTLPEALPPGVFEEAWRGVAAQHAILRTQFRWGPGAEPPVQEVLPSVAVEYAWHDWTGLDNGTAGQWWNRLIARDRARGFDLGAAPLWRVSVAQLGRNAHRVLFTFHHLLLDARALIVLFRDVFASLAGQPGSAPVPYARYLDWLEHRDVAASAGFWRRHLAGFTAPTPLPAAGEPTSAPPMPARRARVIPAAKTARLRTFARAQGVTLATVVQAGWALLLSRYSGEDDVMFGAVRACRHGSVAGAEEIVGLLINTVPLRIACPPTARVGDWLRELRAEWLAMRPHEHVPASTIRGWSEVAAGAPLFETVVSYQEPSWDAVLRAQGGPWAHREFDVLNETSHPLALDAAAGAALQLQISYDASRFTAAVVDRLLEHLANLLLALAAHPGGALVDLPMLAPAESQQLLGDWGVSPADFNDEICIHHLVEEQAARAPDALAVSDPTHGLTYATLNRRANALARRLQALGAGPEVFVGVCVEPSVDLVVALLAVLKSGAAYVPVDPAYPPERVAFMVEDAGMPLLLTQPAHAARFAGAPARLAFVDDPEISSAGAPALLSSAAHPAYLIYTSGSTGTPKGVPITHRSVMNLVAWHQRAYEVTPADRATQLASPAFDACVWELWPYLTAGASIHIPPADHRIAPAQLVPWLCRQGITLCFLPTPLAEAALDEEWPADCALRAILTGGDRLRRWPGHRLPCALINHYGPTECTVVATAGDVPRDAGDRSAPSIGRPIANTEAYVLDRHGRLVPVGVPGELHLGGVGLAAGYHRRPELSAERFVAHPFEPGSGRKLYRTGDLVRWREDGELEYLGRIDQQVKIRGHRIEPAEIEAALNHAPGVRESLVVAASDTAGQPQLVAYVLARTDAPASSGAELAAFLHRRLPAFMVPAAFVRLDAWPLTAHGKVDRRRLPAPGEAAPVRVVQPPRPGLETAIADVWTEVLGRGGLSAGDDFFHLGGHSLRAAQVVSRLNATLHTSLSVRHLFEHSTITSLASAIERLTSPRGPAPALAPHG